MFDKFGEFDSYKELNAAAEEFLKVGNIDSIMDLAEENGIDREDAQDYVEGCVSELSTIFTAAYGRLSVQQKEDIDSKKSHVEKMPLMVINTVLKGMCTSEELAALVMRKGKRITAIYDAMKEEASKHMADKMGMCCGTDRELCNIIRAYYTKSEKDFKKSISDLYKE